MIPMASNTLVGLYLKTKVYKGSSLSSGWVSLSQYSTGLAILYFGPKLSERIETAKDQRILVMCGADINDLLSDGFFGRFIFRIDLLKVLSHFGE